MAEDKKDQERLDRLAAYEDTGFAPEEITALIALPNAQLTLGELREMDGEPVWVVPPADSGWEPCWMIVMVDYCIVAKDVSISRAIYCSFDGCGTDWLAYRRKLEDGTR